MNDTVIAAVIAVGGGLLAAIIAFEGVRRTVKASSEANSRLAEVSERNNSTLLKSTCESKIAEMRVQWNDDLRVSLARFGAAIASAVSSFSTGDTPDDRDKQYWYVYVFLKLNQHDQSHRDLVDIMSEMMTLVNDLLEEQQVGNSPGGKQMRENFQKLFTRYAKSSSTILKQEWDRAKQETRNAWMKPNLGAV